MYTKMAVQFNGLVAARLFVWRFDWESGVWAIKLPATRAIKNSLSVNNLGPVLIFT